MPYGTNQTRVAITSEAHRLIEAIFDAHDVLDVVQLLQLVLEKASTNMDGVKKKKELDEQKQREEEKRVAQEATFVISTMAIRAAGTLRSPSARLSTPKPARYNGA